MKQIEKKIEEILSEKRFREKTMGCFYQSELRKHDRAQRKALQQQEDRVRSFVKDYIDGYDLPKDKIGMDKYEVTTFLNGANWFRKRMIEDLLNNKG